ncbi:MAG: Calx-beta domain-containing protein, partial [Pseudomonadota bacterium]
TGNCVVTADQAGSTTFVPAPQITLTLPVTLTAACGSDNGQSLTGPPVNLCSAGTASLVIGDGPWAWRCVGTDGAVAQCSASVKTFTLTASAGTGGSIDPASVTVKAGKTPHFTLTPSAGNGVASANGCGGTLFGTIYVAAPVSADCHIDATFTAGVLGVARTGSGRGQVTSAPAGIDCGTACRATLPLNTLVTLSATPAPGSVFGGWSGDCATSTAPQCTLMLDQAKGISARFVASLSLTVNRRGPGAGTVSASDGAFQCGDLCSTVYPAPTTVTLTAQPDGNSAFFGWGGTCAEAGKSLTCQVSVTQAQEATASFVPVDAPDLLFTPAEGIRVQEGGTPAVFQVWLNRLPTSVVSVPVQPVNGYCTVAPSVLTFTPDNWDQPQTLTVQAVDDDLVNGSRPCTLITGVMQSDDPLYRNVDPRDLPVAVLDNDGTPHLSLKPAGAIEEGRPAVFQVIASGANVNPNRVIQVGYRTVDDTAKAGVDYQATQGILRIEPGQTLTIEVPTLDDAIKNGTRSFQLELHTAQNGVLDDFKQPAFILDNDIPPTLSVGDVTVIEGNTTPRNDVGYTWMVFPAYLTPANHTQPVTVQFTTLDSPEGSGAGFAHSGTDYRAVSGTLTFAPGENLKEVIVGAIGNTLPEEDKFFLVDLANPQNAVLGRSRAKGIILDDDGSDNISSTVEDLAPNQGDGDNDGIPDSREMGVASRPTATSGGDFFTARVDKGPAGGACERILDVTATQVADIRSDPGFDYPAEAMAFQMDCPEVTITLLFHGISLTDTTGFSLRKYDAQQRIWFTMPDARLSVVHIAGRSVLKAVYTLQGNGRGDSCPEANRICDPVGPAKSQGGGGDGGGDGGGGGGTVIITTAVPPALSAAALIFGDGQGIFIQDGSQQTLTLSNPGTVNLDIQAPQVQGEGFLVSRNCPASLTPNASCAEQVRFQPGRLGPFSATLLIPNSAETTRVPLSARARALDGQMPVDITVTGTPSTLRLGINVPAEDPTRALTTGNLYLGLLSKGILYLHDGRQWQPWGGDFMPVYASGVTPGQRVQLTSLDFSPWLGQDALVYAGFGADASEVLQGRFRLIYVVPRDDALPLLVPDAMPRGAGTLEVSSNVSGALQALSVRGSLTLPAADVGKISSVYVLANTRNSSPNPQWWALGSQGWTPWVSTQTPAYFSGSLPARIDVPLSDHTDLSSLDGTEVWLGYGQDPLEMLRAGRLQLLYIVP